MKVKKQVLIMGVILGLVTVFFLSSYISSLNKAQEVSAGMSYSDVVVAEKLIPAHIRITEDMVKIESIPSEAIHPDAIASVDDIVGTVSKAEIMSGEQLLAARVVADDIETTLAYRIPENMRAITIPVNEVIGVANNITVGDKVDILATYGMDQTTTFTQLQNIEVLALGTMKANSEEESTSQPGTITILVSPAQAEVVAYANIEGSLHLSLRNPIDSKKVNLEHYNLENFQSYKKR